MELTYNARSTWSSERPETLVVCCSDGRWHAPIMEFVRHEVSERADMYAVPGGPAAFDPWNSSFDEARVLEQSLRMFEEHHDLRTAWLIQHEGCAYYRIKHPHLEPAQVEVRQIADLHRAAEVLRARRSHLAIRLIHATLQGDHVVFSTLAPRTEESSLRSGSMTSLL
jgi:hypothetical protein